MAKQFEQIRPVHQRFIEAQQMFFVATAGPDGRVNLSPKGLDSLRVLGANQVAWLNVTGSGNETAVHVELNPRMTLMLMAFEGPPLILRLYGTAKAIHRRDEEWSDLYSKFPSDNGARQVFVMDVDMVQTSCGQAVPLYDFKQQRTELTDWTERIGEGGVAEYWQAKNQRSIDGIETGIVAKNL